MLLLLAVLAPAFLDGSGDVLTLWQAREAPQPPTGLQSKIDEQIAQAQIQQNLVDRIVDTNGRPIIDKELPIPNLNPVGRELTEESNQRQNSANDASVDQTSVTNAQVEEEIQPALEQKKLEINNDQEQVAVKPKQADLDEITKLLQRKKRKWAVQVGAFSNADNANQLAVSLRTKSNYETFVQNRTVNGKTLTLVFVGPILSKEKAESSREDISQKLNVQATVKTYENLGLTP